MVVSALGDADTVRVVVRRDGDAIYDGTAPADVTDDGLHDETTYHYRAVAYDAAGNASVAATATAVTPDRTAPGGSGGAGGLRLSAARHVAGRRRHDVHAPARRHRRSPHTTQHAVTDADAIDNGPPQAPDDVRLSDVTRSGLKVGWDAPADHGTRYRYAVPRRGRGRQHRPRLGRDRAGRAQRRREVRRAGERRRHRTARERHEPRADGPADRRRRTITVVAVDGAGNGSDPSAAPRPGETRRPTCRPDLAATTPTREKPELTWPAVDGRRVHRVRDGDELARVTEPRSPTRHLAEDGTY